MGLYRKSSLSMTGIPFAWLSGADLRHGRRATGGSAAQNRFLQRSCSRAHPPRVSTSHRRAFARPPSTRGSSVATPVFTMACQAYDRMQPLRDDTVRLGGAELNFLDLP